MRIIAGEWRGRPIAAPRGDTTRPTGDRTREALFSMLTSRVGTFAGLTVADLFAGSGALGLEALSRGAAHCLFVEQDREAAATITDNIARLSPGPRTKIAVQSVLALPQSDRSYDVIFMDPPYNTTAASVALDKLARLGWIGPSTWVSIETSAKENMQATGFAVDVARNIGKARIHLLRRITP